MDTRIKELAHNLITYSCDLQPGEKIMIHVFGTTAYPLARQLVKEAYAAGGYPYVQIEDYRMNRELMLGCSDPFCRLTFPWGRENEELLSHYRFLGTLRKEHPALRDGIFRVITARNGALLFERKGGTETLFVAVNLGKEPFPVPLPDGCRVLTGPEGTAPVLVCGEYAVFRKKN